MNNEMKRNERRSEGRRKKENIEEILNKTKTFSNGNLFENSTELNGKWSPTTKNKHY